jgi:hypothetical protein
VCGIADGCGSQLKRRQFIALLGCAATAWPPTARAQQPGRLPTIGYMNLASAATFTRGTTAFVQRLREVGWIEGRTVAIDYRWVEGRYERFSEIAAELVRLKVDVIVTSAPGAAAAKALTSVTRLSFPWRLIPLAVASSRVWPDPVAR